MNRPTTDIAAGVAASALEVVKNTYDANVAEGMTPADAIEAAMARVREEAPLVSEFLVAMLTSPKGGE